MYKTSVILALAAILLAASCGKGKKEQVENVVKVKTAVVGTAAEIGEQSYSGTIEEKNGSELSFAGMGTIKEIYVHEGQNVKAGQLIGILDATTNSNALTMAKASTAQALESLRQAEDAYKRMKMLHDNGSLTEIKWVEVQTKVSQARQLVQQAQASEKIARKGLSDTHLTAPFSGYISKKAAEVGQNVTPGMPIVKLVKIDQVNVKISVPENEIAKIHIGQNVQFSVSSLENTIFNGKLTEKGVAADPLSRQYEVKALAQNPSHKLLPGMVCDVYTTTTSQEQSISIPANVIQIDIDNKPFVWTVKRGKAHKQSVLLGENIGENVTIKSGLYKGQQIIVEGQQKVSNGTSVSE